MKDSSDQPRTPETDDEDIEITDIQYIDENGSVIENEGTKQMELFISATSEHTTNAIYLYDAAPKYSHDEREMAVTVSAFEHKTMTLKGSQYDVEIQAARVQKPDGSEVLIKPGFREECIEDSLRKLAGSGNGVFINGEAGVRFSLYELRSDLKSVGHTYSYDQLREGLYVMRRAGLKITDPRSGESWEEGYLGRLVEGGKRTSEAGPVYEQWYASFHKLVTKSIIDLTYRQMDYRTLMSIGSPLAKYIFKRMSLIFTQASTDTPYQPTLVQLLTESGRGLNDSMKVNVKAVKRAFDQLKESDVILAYEETKRVKEGRKLKNIHYDVYPTKKFIRQTIEANKQAADLKTKSSRAKLQALKEIIPTEKKPQADT